MKTVIVRGNSLVQMSSEEYQARAGSSYELGQIAHAEGLATRFNRMAGEAYAKKEDEVAKVFRSLAEMFVGESKKLRECWQDRADKLEKMYPNES